MKFEQFKRLGEIDSHVETLRQQDIAEIKAKAAQRDKAAQPGGEIAVRREVGIPYSGNEDRTVVDIQLPDMTSPESRANLPA